MSFTHNDLDQCDIINHIIILTKRGADKIYTILPKKHYRYPSTTILKHANALVKVNKPPYEVLHNMTPHDTYIITIHVYTMTLVDISHEQKDLNPVIEQTGH